MAETTKGRLTTGPSAAPAEQSELDGLRQENARLKARVQELEAAQGEVSEPAKRTFAESEGERQERELNEDRKLTPDERRAKNAKTEQ